MRMVRFSAHISRRFCPGRSTACHPSALPVLLGNMQRIPQTSKVLPAWWSGLLEAEHPKAFLCSRWQAELRGWAGPGGFGRKNFGVFAKISSCGTGTGSSVIKLVPLRRDTAPCLDFLCELCGAPPQEVKEAETRDSAPNGNSSP